MDIGDVLSQSWKIIWKHKVLWIFGLLAGCGTASTSTGNGGVTYQVDAPTGLEQYFADLDPGLVAFGEAAQGAEHFLLGLSRRQHHRGAAANLRGDRGVDQVVEAAVADDLEHARDRVGVGSDVAGAEIVGGEAVGRVGKQDASRFTVFGFLRTGMDTSPLCPVT